MLITILLFPLLGCLSSFLFSYYLSRDGGLFITTLCLQVACFHSLLALKDYISYNNISQITLFCWYFSDNIKIDWGLLFDGVSLIMCIIITLISACVHTYTIDYMSTDPYIQLFSSYLSLFTFFMLLLVCSNNLVFMYFGWEGVGIMSYLLINYWDSRYLANKAALKAMITNRVSDAFFFLGILLLFVHYGTTNFVTLMVVAAVSNTNILILWIACVLILFGVIGKSAQIVFHVWLPDAMEGPTPVSALLHAATMVTAGIILLIRCSSIMSYFSSILIIITFFGSLTACMAAFASVFQTDIKKVIAYSTCSQLGYMVMACGLSYYNVALFHLFNHAFFKALLFLGAGAIIHAVLDEQDMRRLGGLFNFLPFTFFSMLIGSLAIMGIPFFAGFYSKDLILELTYSTYVLNATFLYFLAVFAAFCTAVYSVRLLLFIFFFNPKFFHVVNPHESAGSMTASMFVLFVLSVVVGYLFCDLFIGLGNTLLSETVTYLPLNYYFNNQFLVNPFVKNLPLITTIFGCIFGLVIINFLNLNVRITRKIYYLILKTSQRSSALSYNALYWNIIYNDLFMNSYQYSYSINTKLIDKGIYEWFGPVGIYRVIYNISNMFKPIPSSVFLSLGFMFFSLVVIYFYLILANYALSFYLFNFGMFVNLIIIIYNEYSNN